LNIFNARFHQFELFTRLRVILTRNANDALDGEALETIDALDHDGLHNILFCYTDQAPGHTLQPSNSIAINHCETGFR
jgi:hypothetical protein